MAEKLPDKFPTSISGAGLLNLRATFAALGIGTARKLVSAQTLLPTAIFAMVSQVVSATNAQSLPLEFNGDSLVVDYPADRVVRIDKGLHNDYTRTSLASFELIEPGYVLVFCRVVYSEDQSNESFFIDVCNVADGLCTRPCGANVGDALVVVDDRDTIDYNTVRFAGRFFLPDGTHEIYLNHYADIAVQFPDFWMCEENRDCAPGVGTTPESVHLQGLVLVREPDMVYDVGIEKSANTESAGQGERVDFELEIGNSSSSTVYDIEVRDETSALDNLDFDGQPAGDHDVFSSWHLDSLTAGEAVLITYSGDLGFGSGDTFIASAYVKARCDGNPANDTSSVTVHRFEPAPQYDLALDLSSVPDSLFSGQQIILQLKVCNKGPDDASPFEVLLSRPGDISYTLVDFPDYSDEGDSLVFRFNGLHMNDAVHIRIVAVVERETEAFCPATKVFLARLAAPNDEVIANNTAQTEAYVKCRPAHHEEPNENPAYDLKVVKSASNTKVGPGETTVYRLTVQNLGPVAASDVTLHDPMPPELLILSAFPNDYLVGENGLEWSLPAIPPGDSVVIEITTSISPDSLGHLEELIISNLAYVEAPLDSNTANDSSVVQITYEPEEPQIPEPPFVEPPTAGRFECIMLDRNVFAPELDENLTISFILPVQVNVSINMFDLAGTFVTNIVEQPFQQGAHSLQWDGLSRSGEKVGSGVYVMIFEAPSFKKCVQKVIVAR
jgi:uncharacterized repeat protein (TIGR01451 family)